MASLGFIVIVGFLLTAVALLATSAVGLFKPQAVRLQTRDNAKQVMGTAVVRHCQSKSA